MKPKYVYKAMFLDEGASTRLAFSLIGALRMWRTEKLPDPWIVVLNASLIKVCAEHGQHATAIGYISVQKMTEKEMLEWGIGE